MYKVKICGVTSAEDALLAADAGADAIGLNFYEKSPRHVPAERAEEIVKRLRKKYSATDVQVYGVFVNAPLDEILWTIRAADLYGVEQGFGIQLHGDEPPQLHAQLHAHGLGRTGDLSQASDPMPEVPIVRAFRVRDGQLAPVREYLQQCYFQGCLPQAVLLDAYSPTAFGGTGQRLDWASINGRGSALLNLPLVLAGGLTPENVAMAIQIARPTAVDTASGVEKSPGIKDAAKVMAFVHHAKRAFSQLTTDN